MKKNLLLAALFLFLGACDSTTKENSTKEVKEEKKALVYNQITKITDNLGGLSIVSEQHGYATCLNYNDEYLIIYQSNWGFGYALSKEHYIDLY